MKNKYLLIPVLLLFLFSVVFAQPQPPYIFKVMVTSDGVPVGNVDVTIRNLDYNSDITETMATENNGGTLFALCEDANSCRISYYYSSRGNYGDRMEVKVCNDPTNVKCITSYEIGKDCPTSVDCMVKIDLAPGTVVISDGEEKTIEEVIKEVQTTKYTTKYVCSDGTEVDDASQCPEETDEWFWAMIAVLSAALIAAGCRWGKGFIGLLKYWFSKDKLRAKKMLKTALKKWVWQK